MAYSDKVIIDRFLGDMNTDPGQTFWSLLRQKHSLAESDVLSRVVRAYIAELIARYKGQINVNKIMGLPDRSNDVKGTKLYNRTLEDLNETIHKLNGFSRDDMSHYVVFYESEAAKAIRASGYHMGAPRRELSRNMGF